MTLQAYRALRAEGACRCGDAPWSVDAFFAGEGGGGGGVDAASGPDLKNGPDENVTRGMLHCVDNMVGFELITLSSQLFSPLFLSSVELFFA